MFPIRSKINVHICTVHQNLFVLTILKLSFALQYLKGSMTVRYIFVHYRFMSLFAKNR